MTFDYFIKKNTNKYLDWDGVYGAQCVDLYRYYCKEVLNIPQSPPIPGAKDIWDNYLTEHLTKIPNTPTGVPQKGDIIIWSGNTGGGWGHVAIFIEGNVNSFKSFDQNWPTGTPCHIQGHYYSNVLGWLRPRKEQSMGDSSPELKACLAAHSSLMDEITKVKKELEDVRAEYKAQTEDFRREKEALATELKETKVEYDNYKSQVANKLGTTQALAQVLAELGKLIKNDEDAQKAIDKLREEEVKWNKTKLDLENDIAKLEEQLKTKDLSKQDFEALLRAIIRKLIAIIKQRW